MVLYDKYLFDISSIQLIYAANGEWMDHAMFLFPGFHPQGQDPGYGNKLRLFIPRLWN